MRARLVPVLALALLTFGLGAPPAGAQSAAEPGATRDVVLVPLGGTRTVYGFRGDVMGAL